MSKKVYVAAKLIETWDDKAVRVRLTECDGITTDLYVKRKDLLIVTPNSNIVPWSPAKKKRSKK